MGLLELSHNDDTRSIVQKCNLNFRELSKSMAQSIGREGRSIETDVSQMIATAMSGIVDTVIPNEVALQISNANIPRLVSDEVALQIQTAYPPIGSYLLVATDPSTQYVGTTWQQTDAVTTDGGTVVPLWQRTA